MNKNETKILIVDDEAIVRESLKGWFEEDGYFVETAENAVEALKKFSNFLILVSNYHRF